MVFTAKKGYQLAEASFAKNVETDFPTISRNLARLTKRDFKAAHPREYNGERWNIGHEESLHDKKDPRFVQPWAQHVSMLVLGWIDMHQQSQGHKFAHFVCERVAYLSALKSAFDDMGVTSYMPALRVLIEQYAVPLDKVAERVATELNELAHPRTPVATTKPVTTSASACNTTTVVVAVVAAVAGSFLTWGVQLLF